MKTSVCLCRQSPLHVWPWHICKSIAGDGRAWTVNCAFMEAVLLALFLFGFAPIRYGRWCGCPLRGPGKGQRLNVSAIRPINLRQSVMLSCCHLMLSASDRVL